MNLIWYEKDNFRCLLPDYCNVESDVPVLTVESKNQDEKQTFFGIQTTPTDSVIESMKYMILHCSMESDEHAEKRIIRRGKFTRRYPGVELVLENKWFHNKSIEYIWCLILNINTVNFYINLACVGDFSEEEKYWQQVFDSIELN